MDFILETNRLQLREFQSSDAESAYLLNQDKEVLQYTGDVPFNSVEEAKEFLENYSDYRNNGFGRWAVVRKSDQQFLGWCGLKLHKDNTVDIGYRFHKKYWNQGYATESAKACLEYGFDKLALNEIIGNSDRANLYSIRVLEKIGMKFWKEDKYDGIEDAVIYKLTKEEFNR